jgi:predicted DNA-binding transcriptional regulator AlpA
MKINNLLTSEILNAATAVLSPYVQDLSPEMLLKALETYNEDKEEAPANHPKRPEKPFKREEAAEMLGLSIPTIDRYMAQGKLKRIRYSSHEVRITPDSVYNMMRGGAA